MLVPVLLVNGVPLLVLLSLLLPQLQAGKASKHDMLRYAPGSEMSSWTQSHIKHEEEKIKGERKRDQGFM
jgi:hypothetical protein